ncbi:AraC family transcriptional regulator [Mycobacterium talmoniae]|uniref:AraC family transcriptional regulator n=1 Tax=Mycobacterium talmoniae TaxID=1858794 RepID=A0A1S1NIR1_9MYCO|nr:MULTISPECIES: helix-turn-helix transcriptional regulator [Mycobacterium]OHV05900.1 AraC family transcriptional regulator [Mycobacterium talmoniae]PQM48254.1 HTH-type transcriptional regulator NimR [Mycobacterium talmoniae]TDH57805.1 AraC family transcriptional regulator [Mycobacterium eburneum]
MRNVPVELVDGIDRAVLAIGTDYPPQHLLPLHRHRRAQLLYGATGIMQVGTAAGTWTVPTHRAVLIPPDTDHQVQMDHVSTRSLYIEPAAAPWFPTRCQVVDVSALLRELLLAAVQLPAEYDRHGRDAALIELILHELRTAAPLPFDLPLPARSDLRSLCDVFLTAPSIRAAPNDWAARLRVSARTFNRLFRAQTGLAFGEWRQRACAVHAMRLLSAGRPVTQVAADLDYGSPAAFSAMFARQVGTPPRAFQPR